MRGVESTGKRVLSCATVYLGDTPAAMRDSAERSERVSVMREFPSLILLSLVSFTLIQAAFFPSNGARANIQYSCIATFS